MSISRQLLTFFRPPFAKSSGSLYFKTHKGRCFFRPGELKKHKGLMFWERVQLSYYFNAWLDTIAVLRLNEKHKHRLTTCTYTFSSKDMTDNAFNCGLNICPWCQAMKVCMMLNDLKKLEPRGMIVCTTELGGPRVRNRRVTPVYTVRALDNLLDPVLKLRTLTFTSEPSDQFTFDVATAAVSDLLLPKIEVLKQLDLEKILKTKVRQFSKNNASR